MKRIFAYLIVAAALALGASSCIKDVFPEGTEPTPALESEGIDIKVDSVSDNAFEFTLAPKGKSAFYSYLVTAAPAAPDSSLLYAVKYTGLKQGIINYKKASHFSIQMEDLTPNHTYYVYAVAGSEEGNVSPVVSVSVTTTDGVAPRITGSSYKGNVVTIKFSEPVTYVEGKEITAQGFPFLFPTGAPSVEKAVGKVVANGNTADITFEAITQPGTLYVVNVPEGAFIDSVGQKTNGVSSAITGQDEDGQPVFEQGSIYGYVSAGTIETEEIEYPATLADWEEAVPLFKCKTPVAQIGKNAVVAKIIHEEDGLKVTSEYDLQANITYGITEDGYTVVAFLPEEPGRGDEFYFEVAEGAAIDIYGNTSAELSVGPILYSYGFTLADALGTYPASGETALASKEDEEDFNIVLSESDDPEKGNIMISEYLGLPCAIYGEFDGDAGTLTIDMSYAPINVTKDNIGVDVALFWYTISYYVDLVGEERPVTFQFTAPGTISSIDDYFGYYAEAYVWPESNDLNDIDEDADYLGMMYNIFWNTSLTRTDEAASGVAKPTYVAAPLLRKVETLQGSLAR